MNLVKESLAKLLAQEDLIVEHRQVSTAQFNVESRVLTLPQWSHRDNSVVDSLIAHEVGHALYTPNEWGWEGEVPMQFVNVCEDIRIEKLMKRRYGGLAKTFYKGYEILSDEDFFQVEGKDLTEFNLADRLNIHFKIGNFVTVPFDSTEQEFLDDANKLEKFEDAVSLAKRIYAYSAAEQEAKDKEDAEEKGVQQELPLDGQEGGGDQEQEQEGRPDLGKDDTEYEDQQSEVEQHLEQQLQEQNQSEEGPSGGSQAGRNDGPLKSEPKVTTADHLEEALKDLVKKDAPELNYVEIPKTVGDVVISNKEVSDVLDSYYSQKEELESQQDYADEYELMLSRQYTRNLRGIDDEYNKYKVSANKEVNYLVKEFECKKAADSYARATTSRTGVLDTAKLHTYKYNEDLFRKVTTLPEGKNHGLIFNLDWSGSMHHSIRSTMKQLLTLVSFCRKVGIAYDVYLFSDSYKKQEHYIHEDASAEGKIVCHNFNMVNVLTSSANNRKHDRQAKNLFRLASAFAGGGAGGPYQLQLGGTPLNEAMVAMNDIIPAFQKRTGSQKVHVMNLTDGEGYPVGYGKKVNHYRTGEATVIRGRIDHNTFLRDRVTGQSHQFLDGYDQTNTFITQLRNRFPQCEIMNIRLLNGNEWNRFKRQCLGHNISAWADADTEWKKSRSFICTSSAYSVQYALFTGALDNEVDFEVQEDATKAQIKRAFAKTLKSKTMNKKILTSFVERIA